MCKTKLERESAHLEHIESMDHKSKMGEYTSFTNVQQNISKAMQRWESDINYFTKNSMYEISTLTAPAVYTVVRVPNKASVPHCGDWHTFPLFFYSSGQQMQV